MASLFSNSWYRVAELKPRLRAHAQIHRQTFRGQVWYVLQDHQTGRFFRVSPAANRMLCLMDGRRTMREVWDIAGEHSAVVGCNVYRLTRRDFLNGIPLDLNFTREIGFQGHSFTIRIYDRARQPIAVFQADLVGQ